MKTIRYFAMLLAAVSLFVGCSDDDDLSTQNKGKTRPTVTMTKGTVTDTQFIVSMTAAEGATQYAYVVKEGKDNTPPQAKDIVIDEVSGSVMSGAFNVADAATQTITVPCKSATDYQVFAAAINATGLLSEVTTLDVFIPDTTIPSPSTFTPAGNTVSITYSEDIVVGKTGSATVQYIQWGVGAMSKAVTIPAENITTSGKVATIVCPKPGNGAGYIVNVAAGLFEDKSGNKCRAINSGWDNTAKKYVNLGWDDDTVDFPIMDSYFVAQPEDADYNTPTTTIDFVFPFDVMDAEADNAVQVIFKEAEGVMYLNAEYELQADNRTVKVTLPKVPTGAFDVQVAAGAFYDVWGNESAAFTVATDKLRYSNYQIAIKEGLYTIKYSNPADLTGGQVVVANKQSGTPFDMQLVKFNDTYYALNGAWFGNFPNPILLGKVNFATMQIVFDGTWYNPNDKVVVTKSCFNYNFFVSMNSGKYYLAFCSGGNDGTDPLTVSFDDEGFMTEISYFDYSIFENAENYPYVGLFDACADGTMTFKQSSSTQAKLGAGAVAVPTNYVELRNPIAAPGLRKK